MVETSNSDHVSTKCQRIADLAQQNRQMGRNLRDLIQLRVRDRMLFVHSIYRAAKV